MDDTRVNVLFIIACDKRWKKDGKISENAYVYFISKRIELFYQLN